MTGKKKSTSNNVKDYNGMTFINVPVDDKRKDLAREALASGLAHYTNCEDALLSLLKYGKVSVKDDVEHHCYIVTLSHNHPDRKSLDGSLTSYRHKNLITAFVLHLLDAQEKWSEKQRVENKGHGDTDW